MIVRELVWEGFGILMFMLVVWTFALRSFSNIVHLQHHTRPEHSKLHKRTVSQWVPPCRGRIQIFNPSDAHFIPCLVCIGEVSRSICAPFKNHIPSSIASFTKA